VEAPALPSGPDRPPTGLNADDAPTQLAADGAPPGGLAAEGAPAGTAADGAPGGLAAEGAPAGLTADGAPPVGLPAEGAAGRSTAEGAPLEGLPADGAPPGVLAADGAPAGRPAGPEPSAPPAEVPPAEVPGRAGRGVSIVWRGIVLFASISLLVGITQTWADPWTAVAIILGYAGILTCAVLALTMRTSVGMRRLELGVLGVAIILYLAALPVVYPRYTWRTYPGDEGVLTDLAGSALRSGHNPYALSWPHAFAGRTTGITLTLSGHVITRFEYPPVAAILDAVVRPLVPSLPTAGAICAGVLVVTAILMFYLLPSPWRVLAPVLCLSVGLYLPLARKGEPAIIALPLLIIAVYRWTSIGSAGRLGRAGLISAVCLGLAAATQQLAWFLVPFLLLAIYLVRRADLPARAAARIVAGYAGVAVAAFAVVNLPFAAWNFRDWFSAIVSPLTQGAIPNGQGLIGLTYYVSGGSGRLDFYSYAALCYGLALLVCFIVYFRWLGPAVAILPWTILFFPSRSQDNYFIVFAALWVVSLLTVDWASFGRAKQPGARLRWLHAPAGTAAAVALFIPALACLGIAVGSPQPLRVTVAKPTPIRHGRYVAALRVTATNTSGHDISPHFALSSNTATTAYWLIKSGPATLAPGATGTYRIKAPFSSAMARTGPPMVLRVFSAGPDTLSSGRVPYVPWRP
jgi:hypothetical protein